MDLLVLTFIMFYFLKVINYLVSCRKHFFFILKQQNSFYKMFHFIRKYDMLRVKAKLVKSPLWRWEDPSVILHFVTLGSEDPHVMLLLSLNFTYESLSALPLWSQPITSQARSQALIWFNFTLNSVSSLWAVTSLSAPALRNELWLVPFDPT